MHEGETLDPKERFTDRAKAYARHRPSYPNGVLEVLQDEIGLSPGWVVADVGSGTGIYTGLFLSQGHEVFAVEPNTAMRRAAEERHSSDKNFRSVSGSAEGTGLPHLSVDLVVAAQAFHWFDHSLARVEFRRILRTPRWVTVMWNVRQSDAGDLMRGYEAIIKEFRTTPDPETQDIGRFLGGPFRRATIPHEQVLDFEGLAGLLLSASYAPLESDERHASMLSALTELFERHSVEGHVRFSYQTEMYFGCLRE